MPENDQKWAIIFPPVFPKSGGKTFGAISHKFEASDDSELQQLMTEKGVSIGDCIMSLIEKAGDEEVNIKHSVTDMLWRAIGSCKIGDACAKSRINLDVIQMEVESEGETQKPTGRFRRKRMNETTSPAGTWPKHWIDPVHESEGHDVDGSPVCRLGEGHLNNCMLSLYAEHGIEYAVDDISGALLDPQAVHEGRATEMGFFDKLGVYDRVPREEQRQTGGT